MANSRNLAHAALETAVYSHPDSGYSVTHAEDVAVHLQYSPAVPAVGALCGPEVARHRLGLHDEHFPEEGLPLELETEVIK